MNANTVPRVRIPLFPPKRKVALGGFFFLFSSLFSLRYSLFSKEQMRLFQIIDKREEIKEKVALLCKAIKQRFLSKKHRLRRCFFIPVYNNSPRLSYRPLRRTLCRPHSLRLRRWDTSRQWRQHRFHPELFLRGRWNGFLRR